MGAALIGGVGQGVPGRVSEVDHIDAGDAGIQQWQVVIIDVVAGLIGELRFMPRSLRRRPYLGDQGLGGYGFVGVYGQGGQ